MISHEPSRERIEMARKALASDRSQAVPFMAEPEPSPSGRTAPELAYRAMAKAIDGLEPRELRKLARTIELWKRCNEYNRATIEMCAFFVQLEQSQEDEIKKAEKRRSKLALVQ